MSLTFDDLQQIRQVMKEEIAPLDNRLKGVEADVKEIYNMLKPTNEELGNKVKDHEVRISSLESQAV
jgi:hypothetical protein